MHNSKDKKIKSMASNTSRHSHLVFVLASYFSFILSFLLCTFLSRRVRRCVRTKLTAVRAVASLRDATRCRVESTVGREDHVNLTISYFHCSAHRSSYMPTMACEYQVHCPGIPSRFNTFQLTFTIDNQYRLMFCVVLY